MPKRWALLGVAVAMVLAGCGDDGSGEAAATESPPDLPPGQIASCGEAGLGVPPTPKQFGDDATFAGPLGLIGPARDLHGPETVRRRDGSIAGKIPAIVLGRAPVQLSVPDEWVGRVALDFGDLNTAPTLAKAHETVVFKPCRKKKRTRTGYPGGLLFESREPAELEVRSLRTGNVWMLPLGRGTG